MQTDRELAEKIDQMYDEVYAESSLVDEVEQLLAQQREQERMRIFDMCAELHENLGEILSSKSTKLVDENNQTVGIIPSSLELVEQMRGIRMVKDNILALPHI